ncbi:MAG: ACT domain-containing protein [Alphaproteobacteria bacterium]|nr:MAG: ACT domain-containing protein [Alphaproteobacteria bacterium]
MNDASGDTVLISIVSPDEVGLIAGVTGELFDLGANLADTSFAVLGFGCEFSCVAQLPKGVTPQAVEEALNGLQILGSASVKVTVFPFGATHRESAEITHIIEVEGGDRPGLIARMAEVLADFDANVVRMNSRVRPGVDGRNQYITTFAVWMPEGRAETCLAAVHNTAGQLNLGCRYRTA